MCRERWISHLDPNIKKFFPIFFFSIVKNRDLWTPQEDVLLISEYLISSTHWSKIAEKLPGRNVYSVKNRFYSLLLRNNIERKNSHIKEEINNLLEKLESKLPKKIHHQENQQGNNGKKSFKFYFSYILDIFKASLLNFPLVNNVGNLIDSPCIHSNLLIIQFIL